jgi:hypothetical protein
VLSELRQAFAIHVDEGSQLNGVHFELTGGMPGRGRDPGGGGICVLGPNAPVLAG